MPRYKSSSRSRNIRSNSRRSRRSTKRGAEMQAYIVPAPHLVDVPDTTVTCVCAARVLQGLQVGADHIRGHRVVFTPFRNVTFDEFLPCLLSNSYFTCLLKYPCLACVLWISYQIHMPSCTRVTCTASQPHSLYLLSFVSRHIRK